MSDQNSEEVAGPKIRKKVEDAPAEAVAQAPTPEAAPEAAPQTAPEPVVEEPIPTRRVVDPNVGDTATQVPTQSPEELTADAVPEAEAITTDDFAAMFESGGSSAVPKRQRFDIGDQVEGVIVHTDTKFFFVDLGGRGEARAPREQYIDEESGEVELEVGQSATFFVLGINREGVLLGKRFDAKDAGLDAVEQAREAGIPVQGKVISRNKGGFEVELMGVKAFCPVSQIDMNRVEELDVYLNQTLEFRVTEIRQGGRSVVVSRAALQREASEARRKETLKTLQEGSILSGVVRSMSHYGAFVDLGGVDGLVHISELSWGNVNDPTDVVSVGQTVEVKVLSIEQRDGKSPRIGLSMKQVDGDPWETVNEKLHTGAQVDGTVVRVAPFGAFVELLPGIDGLVHVSELSHRHVSRPSDVVNVGQAVRVEILDIDLVRKRISLSMKSVADDPWDTVAENYAPGMEVEGLIEKVEDFGAFVSLEEGVTALLPRSEADLSRGEEIHARFRKGNTIKAKVFSVEPDRRRIALTLREGAEARGGGGGDDRGRRQGGGGGRDRRGGGNDRGRGRDRGRQQGGGGDRSYQDTSGGSFGTLGDLINFNKKK